MSKVQFKRFFSVDSPKAVKAESYGWLNAINYMAPASTAGVGNLCPHASPGCLALCLGWYSGQAGIVSKGTGARIGNNGARKSRAAKARLFMHDRKAFMAEMVAGIERAQREAARKGLKLCVRLNGATDIAWERMRAVGWVQPSSHSIPAGAIRRLHQSRRALWRMRRASFRRTIT